MSRWGGEQSPTCAVRGVRRVAGAWRHGLPVLAVLLLAGCAPAPPPLADAALSSGGTGEDVRVVYVAPAAEGCAGSSLSGFVAYRDGLVMAENTCTPEAGGDDSEPHFRLVEASPAGVRELPLPEGVSSKDGVGVLGASDDVVFVSTTDKDDGTTSLWQRRTGGEWLLLTRPAAYGDRYAGDGGPASKAVIAYPQDVVVGPDGSIYVLEPNAVRRIDPNGIIETVAGSNKRDPADLADSYTWGSAGVPFVSPDPRPLPPGPVEATEFPLPRLTAMDVGEDGTVWIASLDAILRLGTDGLIAVHADASTMVPDDTASALVGSRGSSSSIVSLTVTGDSLLLIDAWSNRLLRLQDQRLSLVVGRPQEQRASCPDPVLDDTLSPAQVCAGNVVKNQTGGAYVSQYQGIVTLPAMLLDVP